MLVFVIVLICIVLLIEILVRGMPERLARASRDNCYRLDGSWSNRRAAHETAARNRVRGDLLAVLFLVALAGYGWIAYVHNYVIEIPLAWRAVSLMRWDSAEWKSELYKQDVVHDFQVWARSSVSASPQQIAERQRALWESWLTVPSLAIVWLFGGIILVPTVYVRSLWQFEKGVKQRSEIYATQEISRMAYQAELAQRFRSSAS